MSSLRDKLKSNGYDQEEAYFHQKNRELIQELNQGRRRSPKLTLVNGEANSMNSSRQSSAPARNQKKAA